MENTKATIETLNDLLLINNNRIAGFEHAIKELAGEDAGLKAALTRLMREPSV